MTEENNIKLHEIPEGWVQVVPYDNSLFIHPKEFNIYDYEKLKHSYVFITNYDLFRCFDKVTGEMLKCEDK